jgi:hypothetical protein
MALDEPNDADQTFDVDGYQYIVNNEFLERATAHQSRFSHVRIQTGLRHGIRVRRMQLQYRPEKPMRLLDITRRCISKAVSADWQIPFFFLCGAWQLTACIGCEIRNTPPPIHSEEDIQWPWSSFTIQEHIALVTLNDGENRFNPNFSGRIFRRAGRH